MEANIQALPAKLLGPCLFLAAMVGCAISPPYQEMSDARQAVSAARDVEAGKYAPATLNEAEELLKRAESNLKQRQFEQAHSEAVAAKEKAIEARDRAVEASRTKTGP